MLRTHTCGDLSKQHIGERVTLCGWVQSVRDHGGVIFINLRDRYGETQIVCDPRRDQESHREAERVRKEWVVRASGVVEARPPESLNPNMATGEIEIACDKLETLSVAQTPPLEIDDSKVANEEIRLRYRYLDLRRPSMQRNLTIRHRVAQAVRQYLSDRGFLEIETPLFVRSTPEGARDFVVPSRLYPGRFYALPQSPQLYKQLLMVAGVDRYFQLAPCFRDEDQRADRQPVHTQIDLEMSFVDEADVFEVVEGIVATAFKAGSGIEVAAGFPRMSYQEAIDRYGLDKPDTRFGMELIDYTDLVADCGFSIFSKAVANGGQVKGLNIKGGATMPRREIDELGEFVKIYKAKGLAWMRVTDDGLESSIAKFFTEQELTAIRERAQAEPSDLLVFVADTPKVVATSLGWLRNHLARKLDLIPDDVYNFIWITDFPMFDWNEEENRWEPMHHMFTMPKQEDMQFLASDPGRVKGRLYDLVLNGMELGSGSIRINRPDIQAEVMNVIGMDRAEAERRFGFLLKAFDFGAPPHGGFALGLDRLVAQIAQAESMRDVIAFPYASGVSLVDGSPAEIDEQQLRELRIRVVGTEGDQK
ncbi:MAG TPA: aspartate--tRNA ligase [Bacillota bacterium]|mgnify:FL=1|nr:aspartate--tRNA ligase [Bacillota bacterium]HPZ53895.1 aspartate--tRNA ligase [Bacillota bacterium]HQD17404.1 aspartate--tRNA ligase [Bacillota bacterium]